MIEQVSRAGLLSRGAKGGAALLVAGSAVGALAGSAQAAAPPDADLAYVRMLISAELLGADFYGNAIAAQPYGSRGQKDLKLALANERTHYALLAATLTNAGQTPLTSADIDFTYPSGAFTSTASVTKLAVTLESLFLGAYLGATGGMQTLSLVQPLAQIAANQAQHLSVFMELLGHSAFKAALPPPLSIDEATAALAMYTG